MTFTKPEDISDTTVRIYQRAAMLAVKGSRVEAEARTATAIRAGLVAVAAHLEPGALQTGSRTRASIMHAIEVAALHANVPLGPATIDLQADGGKIAIHGEPGFSSDQALHLMVALECTAVESTTVSAHGARWSCGRFGDLDISVFWDIDSVNAVREEFGWPAPRWVVPEPRSGDREILQ